MNSGVKRLLVDTNFLERIEDFHLRGGFRGQQLSELVDVRPSALRMIRLIWSSG